ncbi:hypothetical protein EYC84_008285 [Monilinia fructicola]|uniref:Uncharacterized protein n=1 Tax=Monilinia fructicola TaxID=38448 RepID=A0A5M9JGP3_MONFR|nr:hypothetical protein EYC84_008285 [Monilinia fructicola]
MRTRRHGTHIVRKGLWSYVNMQQKVAGLSYARSSKVTKQISPRDVLKYNDYTDFGLSSTSSSSNEVPPCRTTTAESLSPTPKTSRCIQTAFNTRTFGTGDLADRAVERLRPRTNAASGYLRYLSSGSIHDIIAVLFDYLEHCVIFLTATTLG